MGNKKYLLLSIGFGLMRHDNMKIASANILKAFVLGPSYFNEE